MSLIIPKKKSFKRYVEICSSNYSILRTLQFESIKIINLAGKSLDLGGGINANYNKYLTLEGILESVNIDKNQAPTFLADIEKNLPINNEIYDNIICFNTLEHIYDINNVLRECARVLKPNGEFYILVPFLFQIHSNPLDYSRHTYYWWENTLSENFYDILIEPLVWDRLSTAYSLIEIHTFKKLFRPLIFSFGLMSNYFSLLRKSKDTQHELSIKNAPLGYFIKCKKKPLLCK
jgi:SAM-dependent methyltransferase